MNTFVSPRSNFTVAIIAGGQSRRMGRDKAPFLRDLVGSSGIGVASVARK